jgi:GGDEF domain-containing protein
VNTVTFIAEQVELFDRSRLLVDLDEATDPAGPDAVLVVVRLSGFGDTSGESGIDPVVAQLRERFAALVGSSGTAYRTRSTELCAILDGDARDLSSVLGALQDVFAAEAEQLDVRVSTGLVELPGEAHGAPEALALADRRLTGADGQSRPG